MGFLWRVITVEKIMWYGVVRNGKIYRFINLEKDYIKILNMLRSGIIPETEKNPSETIPDLREIILSYEKERINEEFSGDQYIIKIYSVKRELDEIINLYLEKLLSIYMIMDINYGNDPCAYFNKLLNSDVNDIDRLIANMGIELCQFREKISDYLYSKLNNYMPNTVKLIGYDLCLEFLWKSGGLKNLVKYPASTLQILGAEKSFFKHMRTGSPSPKYGILFNYPGLSSLPVKKRGKIARIIANKMAITIKMDYFGRSGDVQSMRDYILEKMKN